MFLGFQQYLTAVPQLRIVLAPFAANLTIRGKGCVVGGVPKPEIKGREKP